MAKVSVNKKGARRVRGGHLWIYKSDLVRIEAGGGEIVTVVDEGNNFVGRAFYSDKSEISLRIFTTDKDEIDKEFWRRRVRDADERRNILRSSPTDSQPTNAGRLINSESDLIPGLIVDNYDGNLVLQTLTQGTEKLKETLLEILIEEFQPKSIVERNDAKVRLLEGLAQINSVLYGKLADEIVIEQDGVKFYVSLLEGQKTGSFLDQRENHFAARRYAFGRALDCFTFNGGFAFNLAQQSDSVVAIDISAEAIKQAERNAGLNELSNVEFRTANVFDALREFEKNGEKFDTIVLDPPSFVKNRSALKGAVRGYKEINLRALKLLNPGGILITCSCSYHFTEEIFLEVLEEASRDARRRLHLLEKRMQAADHPVLLGMPESYYLKCFILRAVS
jgi:23S rRNA (cytosine1962-C5)-methyltransferase